MPRSVPYDHSAVPLLRYRLCFRTAPCFARPVSASQAGAILEFRDPYIIPRYSTYSPRYTSSKKAARELATRAWLLAVLLGVIRG